jgi:hypothetical protein
VPGFRNRVTPLGEIVAVPGRGTLMGNRGILHNAQRAVVRDWQVRRWIACRLEFRGRHREVMTLGTYTELFFLDEAAAFADGHRPCAECRHADYQRFRLAWSKVHAERAPSAEAMDAILHNERRVRPWVKRTHRAEIGDLPGGTFIAEDGRAWLVHGNELLAWSAEGYADRRPRPVRAEVTLLTPPSIVAVFLAGYRAELHPSATAGARPPGRGLHLS